MHRKYLRTLWDMTAFHKEYNKEWLSVINKLKKKGYQGLEIAVQFSSESQLDAFKVIKDKKELSYVAQIHTCGYPIISSDVNAHLDSLKKGIETALKINPDAINIHSGRDCWTQDQTLEFFNKAQEIQQHVNVPIQHETHRQRALFNPYITKIYHIGFWLVKGSMINNTIKSSLMHLIQQKEIQDKSMQEQVLLIKYKQYIQNLKQSPQNGMINNGKIQHKLKKRKGHTNSITLANLVLSLILFSTQKLKNSQIIQQKITILCFSTFSIITNEQKQIYSKIFLCKKNKQIEQNSLKQFQITIKFMKNLYILIYSFNDRFLFKLKQKTFVKYFSII
ncbi:hypothetical protein TTHERM_00127170 (macronuclear) [Tetrahymena thermophila SB210]|uniref:Xylose isomerase-like TIM barrel domain-containing protein n=1 Tax=Tetrahymena thermophila (strain SB210) TaxID=312017 RepID=I7M1C3_TETTS|nr:hypothetical protein TTHERM_00127170 [Tetrahymena thermophila SB210]EAR96052.3 hypothetical protein TTHERM_00127170 [Tetrahymena thermophila SB210]|eukprot:XP_001016297.3 hypothetical protein TTHERM_00127170 [Tetrahymena thermophila SB210]